MFTLLTYNHYLKVLWLCVFNTVPIFEYCSVFLLNVLLFLASSVVTISMVFAVCPIPHTANTMLMVITELARNTKTFNSNRNTEQYSNTGTALKTHNHSTFK